MTSGNPAGRFATSSAIGAGLPLIRFPSRSMGESPGNGSLPLMRWCIEQPSE